MTGGPLRPHATTIIAVRKDGQVAMAGDGQVTIGDVVLKHNARKLRPLYNDRVLAGFAGAVADALTLFEKFEVQLERYRGNLRKASVELTKEWRTDRFLRRLEAQLIVADSENLLLLSGEGDVIEPDEGIIAIGTGGPYALAAGLALIANTDMDAGTIARTAMTVASRICIFTNDSITLHTIDPEGVHDESPDPDTADVAEPGTDAPPE
ncbi:MAG TPA: ATP-dependent protease subunit HslV [Chloroflexia bacterium]|nr:ATP-dependent protease subunit HslV [Chloroflexia bacterium]